MSSNEVTFSGAGGRPIRFAPGLLAAARAVAGPGNLAFQTAPTKILSEQSRQRSITATLPLALIVKDSADLPASPQMSQMRSSTSAIAKPLFDSCNITY